MSNSNREYLEKQAELSLEQLWYNLAENAEITNKEDLDVVLNYLKEKFTNMIIEDVYSQEPS